MLTTIADALYVLDNTQLDAVVIEDQLIEKEEHVSADFSEVSRQNSGYSVN